LLPPLVGTLRQHMPRTRRTLSEMKRIHYLWMEQIVQGLQYLFDRGYVHIDLSLDTVMVSPKNISYIYISSNLIMLKKMKLIYVSQSSSV